MPQPSTSTSGFAGAAAGALVCGALMRAWEGADGRRGLEAPRRALTKIQPGLVAACLVWAGLARAIGEVAQILAPSPTSFAEKRACPAPPSYRSSSS